MGSRIKLLLLHVYLLQIASAAQTPLQTFTRKVRTDPNIKLLTILHHEPGENNIYPYAICEKGHEKHCTVVYEHYRPDGLTTINKCHTSFYTNIESDLIHLRSARNGTMIFTYTDIVGFYKDIVDAYQIFRVIDTNTCKYRETKIHVKNSKPQDAAEERRFFDAAFQQQVIQRDDGSFEVFLLYPDACRSSRCRYSIDSAGRQIGEPVDYLPEEFAYREIRMQPIKYMLKNYFVVVNTPDVANFFERKHRVDLDVKILYAKAGAKYEELLHFENQTLYDFDSSHSHFGVCWKDSLKDNRYITRINCRLIDSDMWDLMSVVVEYPYNITAISVKNLPGDEMVILTNECSARGSCDEYYLRKIRADGRLGDNIEMSGFHCDDGLDVYSSKRMVILSADERFVCILCTCKSANKDKFMRWCYETNDF